MSFWNPADGVHDCLYVIVVWVGAMTVAQAQASKLISERKVHNIHSITSAPSITGTEGSTAPQAQHPSHAPDKPQTSTAITGSTANRTIHVHHRHSGRSVHHKYSGRSVHHLHSGPPSTSVGTTSACSTGSLVREPGTVGPTEPSAHARTLRAQGQKLSQTR
jgi:hypothetical protein